MPFLSPAKLLVILVVALIVLGPDKLPKVAKQIGALWGDLRKMRERLESEVRGSFPDLPSTDTITQAVRSPLSFLDNLADTHASENGTTSIPLDGSEPFGASGDRASGDRASGDRASGDAVQPPTDANRPAGTSSSVRAAEEPIVIPGVSIADPGGVVHRVRSAGVVVPDDPGMN